MMKLTLNLLFIIALNATYIFGQSPSSGEEDWNKNQKLRKHLLKNYDKLALPQRHPNLTTIVYVGLFMRSFDLDDKTQILTLNSFMAMKWYDARLKWDYKDYGGLSTIHFGDDELWKPDFSVYNNADTSEVDHYGNVHFLVGKTGLVFWVPPASMKVYCQMDLRNWPFDEHTCSIILGSWSSSGWQIYPTFFHNRTKLQTEGLNVKNQWSVVEATQEAYSFTYSETKELYVTLHYALRLKRKSPLLAVVVGVPLFMFPIYLLTQFLLPVDHPHRLFIGYICSLLVLLELLYIKAVLPNPGAGMPLIATFYSECFVLVILFVALSVVLARVTHSQNPLLAFAPPQMLKRILTGHVATVLGLKQHASKVGLSSSMAEDGEVLDEGKEPNYSHEWLFVAKVVDRICLIVVCIIFVFSFIHLA